MAAYKNYGQTNRLRNYMQKRFLLETRPKLLKAPLVLRSTKLVLQAAQNSEVNIEDIEPQQLKLVGVVDGEE